MVRVRNTSDEQVVVGDKFLLPDETREVTESVAEAALAVHPERLVIEQLTAAEVEENAEAEEAPTGGRQAVTEWGRGREDPPPAQPSPAAGATPPPSLPRSGGGADEGLSGDKPLLSSENYAALAPAPSPAAPARAAGGRKAKPG